MGNAFYYGVCNRILCKMTLWLSCFMLVRNTTEAIIYRTIFHGGNLWWHWFGNTRAVLLSTQPNKVYAWANRRIGGNVWEKSVPGCVDERGSGKETRYWWIKSAGKKTFYRLQTVPPPFKLPGFCTPAGPKATNSDAIFQYLRNR